MNVSGVNGGMQVSGSGEVSVPQGAPIIANATPGGQVIQAAAVESGVNSGAQSTPKDGIQTKGMDSSQIQRALHLLNQMLAGKGTKIEIDRNAPPSALWFNVVDSVTGVVIERLPPEGIRQFVESQNAKGMAFDLKL